MPPTIGDYYRAALEDTKQGIDRTPDDQVMGMDAEQWIDYLVAKHGMEEIRFDESREITMAEVEREYTQRGYDFYTDRPPGTIVREVAVRLLVPVEPSDTLKEIWNHKLSPNTYSLSYGYPPFEYDHAGGLFSDTVRPEKAHIDQLRERIKQEVSRYNSSIAQEQPQFRSQVRQLVNSRRQRVQEKHKQLDDLATVMGIPLRKKADPSKVVPTAPKVRATIAPVLPPPSRPPTRPVLEEDKFRAILELLDNSGRQFERTPQAFQQLTEEGLRDIILGSLNTVFEGAAGGETFQGDGKTDIHLRISKGEVFIAELKFWSGPESLREVIGQLRGRLTWRDAYGVAIVLSTNAGFSDVLSSVRDALSTCEGFAAGTLLQRAANHFVARFSILSDTARQATLHVLVYNLHVADPGGRVVKKKGP
jgi:hypothetical protein